VGARTESVIARSLAVLVVALGAIDCPWALAATPLDDLVKPAGGSAACFTRVYDAAHLRAHAKQKITAMTVLLRYRPAGGGTAPVALSVSLGIVQRGDPDALYSDGGCDWEANRDTSDRRLIKNYPKEAGMVCLQSAQPDVFDATSAEEGGNLILDRGKERDTLMVYLDDSLTMVKRAARRTHLFTKFGSDDRVFMLRRADMKACAAIEDAVSTPEPDVTPGSR
jgi:hypothetical protein